MNQNELNQDQQTNPPQFKPSKGEEKPGRNDNAPVRLSELVTLNPEVASVDLSGVPKSAEWQYISHRVKE